MSSVTERRALRPSFSVVLTIWSELRHTFSSRPPHSPSPESLSVHLQRDIGGFGASPDDGDRRTVQPWRLR